MYFADDYRQLAWDALLIKGWGKDVRMQSPGKAERKDLYSAHRPSGQWNVCK